MISMEKYKKCTNCGEIKLIRDFHKRKDSKDGYRSHCKKCFSSKTKALYIKNNPKKEKELLNVGFKRCGKCKTVKAVVEFYINRFAVDGLTCQCKKCTSIKSKQYRKKNRDKTVS